MYIYNHYMSIENCERAKFQKSPLLCQKRRPRHQVFSTTKTRRSCQYSQTLNVCMVYIYLSMNGWFVWFLCREKIKIHWVSGIKYRMPTQIFGRLEVRNLLVSSCWLMSWERCVSISMRGSWVSTLSLISCHVFAVITNQSWRCGQLESRSHPIELYRARKTNKIWGIFVTLLPKKNCGWEDSHSNQGLSVGCWTWIHGIFVYLRSLRSIVRSLRSIARIQSSNPMIRSYTNWPITGYSTNPP